ncbi:c-type cytochrome [Jannaschia formosa]|uniref:c-type cytochrome n=1 Tax=Jannaschia formosa TaxID=2259592 RepID=UPI000E1BB443|nr:cytochrome c [Jannaschia formosa]TFL16797.1 cytochrome c [Jannaschia formosa]
MTNKLGAGIAIGIVGTILVAIAVWLTVVYTGVYNVAASDPHADAVRWTFDTTMHRSVERQSDGIELPETFSAELFAQGASHYAESCVHCHGAPGQDPTAWSRGMKPQPPHLIEAAANWSAEEIYWIVENGIKMSGMPAFGDHHGPEAIAAITAFVSRLPGLSPDDYRALTAHDGTSDTAGALPASGPSVEVVTGGAGADPTAAAD